MRTAAFLVFTSLIVLSFTGSILLIGKPRTPITAGAAVGSFFLNGGLVVLVYFLWAT